MRRVTPLLIAYASWFTFVLAWNMLDRPAKTTATPRASRERLHLLVITLGIVLLVLGPTQYLTGRMWVNPAFVDWLMLLVMAAGIAWYWWPRRHLGRFWSASVTHKEGHRIVDTGPYRLVRHPMYTGMIVMDAGMAVVCTTPLALAAVPVMTVGLRLKARVEEQFLSEELGAAAYGRYKNRTPMLVPRLPRGLAAGGAWGVGTGPARSPARRHRRSGTPAAATGRT
jgi:protein-S-isoprenylcysteine O-methyltransferase Ste14